MAFDGPGQPPQRPDRDALVNAAVFDAVKKQLGEMMFQMLAMQVELRIVREEAEQAKINKGGS